MTEKRSLYQCANAKVLGDKIYCDKGHSFIPNLSFRDTISINLLARGKPLEYKVCQDCPDYVELGPPIPKEERGWVIK